MSAEYASPEAQASEWAKEIAPAAAVAGASHPAWQWGCWCAGDGFVARLERYAELNSLAQELRVHPALSDVSDRNAKALGSRSTAHNM